MLASLSAIRSDKEWEVLLVDNASTDSTQSILNSAAQCSRNLRVMHVPQVGLGAARDAAWRAANGRIVAFTDDDCYLESDFVDELLQAFERHADAGCVGGRILLFDPEDARVTIDEGTEVRRIDAYSIVTGGMLHGANLAFRRCVLEQIGGIDARLGAGTKFASGEDTDAIAATVWSGHLAVFDPRPTVYHHHRRRATDLKALTVGYDRGRGAFFAKRLIDARSRWVYLRYWLGPFSHKNTLESFLRELQYALLYLSEQRQRVLLALLLLLAGPAAVVPALRSVHGAIRSISSHVRHPLP